ncbi:hypothetical protein ACS0TY_031756 [Phlomoides rotata]
MEYSFNSTSFDGIYGNYIGFQAGLAINRSSSSLVLNNERSGALHIKPPQKAASADKALIALRNHSDAERRRRERINGHLATLRTLIPGTNKMDKAALLGEVINQVKLLRQSVSEATKGTLIPSDIDEMKVEEEEDGSKSISIRASLCCDFRQDLLSDLKESLEALPMKTIRAEIATLGSRMVSVFVMSGDGEDMQVVVDNVRQALRSVLDKFYASEEYSSRDTPSKRRRASFFAPSGSSSLDDHVW